MCEEDPVCVRRIRACVRTIRVVPFHLAQSSSQSISGLPFGFTPIGACGKQLLTNPGGVAKIQSNAWCCERMLQHWKLDLPNS